MPIEKKLTRRDDNGNGWYKWQNLVLSEIKRLNECSLSLEGKLDRIEELVTQNRLKLYGVATILGFIGGLFPLAIAVLIKIL